MINSFFVPTYIERITDIIKLYVYISSNYESFLYRTLLSNKVLESYRKAHSKLMYH